nr:glutamic acid-rich protein-like [Procambarus clarkii]
MSNSEQGVGSSVLTSEKQPSVPSNLEADSIPSEDDHETQKVISKKTASGEVCLSVEAEDNISTEVKDEGDVNNELKDSEGKPECKVSSDNFIPEPDKSDEVPKKSKNQLKREKKKALWNEQKEEWKEKKRQKKLEKEKQEMEELKQGQERPQSPEAELGPHEPQEADSEPRTYGFQTEIVTVFQNSGTLTILT